MWNYSKYIIIILILIFTLIFFAEEANAFAEPIVRKASEAQRNIIRIGKVITAISFICALMTFIIGSPQWKWIIYITLGGTVLTAVDPIVKWIIA